MSTSLETTPWLAVACLLCAVSCGAERAGPLADDERDDSAGRTTDGAVPLDASRPRMDAAAPPRTRDQDAFVPAVESKQLRVECELRHPVVTARDYQTAGTNWGYHLNKLELAPDGSAYVAGTFRGELDLGAEKLDGGELFRGFVHKLDHACRPVRTLMIAPSNAGDTVVLQQIAVDPQDNLYVVFASTVVTITDDVRTEDYRELVLEKFSSGGESLYRRRLTALLSPPSVEDMTVDAEGRVTLIGGIGTFGDLGGGLLISLEGAFLPFAVVYDAQGKFLAQRVDLNFSSIANAGEVTGALAYSGGSRNIFEFLLTLGQGAPTETYVVALDASNLSERWRLKAGYDSWPWSMTPLRAGGFAVSMVNSAPDGEGRTDESQILRLSATGQEQRRTALVSRSYRGDPEWVQTLMNTRLRETARGGLLVSGTHSIDKVVIGDVVLQKVVKPRPPVDPNAPTLVDPFAYPQHPFLLELDEHDVPLWGETVDWGGVKTTLGYPAPTADGAIFVAGTVDHQPEDIGSLTLLDKDFVVRRLRYVQPSTEPPVDSGVVDPFVQ